jgi:hypothetical protein
MKFKNFVVAFLVLITIPMLLTAQIKLGKGFTLPGVSDQQYDTNYVAPTPQFPANTGTTIYIDEAHFNFHTAAGRYKPFADLLRNDGYQIASFTSTFTRESLEDVQILVIANSVNEVNSGLPNWVSPVLSAFTEDEIVALSDWIYEGGKLLLIADHFPFPGAVESFVERFGIRVNNGYNFSPAYYPTLRDEFLDLDIVKQILAGQANPQDNEVIAELNRQVFPVFIELGAEVNALSFWSDSTAFEQPAFRTGDGVLSDHIIKQGRPGFTEAESVSQVTIYTGHHFTVEERPGQTAIPLMLFGEGTFTANTEKYDAYFGDDVNQSNDNLIISLLTTQQIPEFTVPVVESEGELQAALIKAGAGTLAFFAEAGMFTAQIAADGQSRMGVNNERAQHNWKFNLNLIRYLDGFLKDEGTSVNESTGSHPASFTLHQNYPNPFNPETRITFQLADSDWVRLEVLDVTGRQIASLVDQYKSAGTHSVRFDANGLASGLYLYRLSTRETAVTKKMLLVR